METYYFTFGFNHIHPQTAVPLRDYWIEVDAPSFDKATEIMNSEFQEWSSQYHEKAFMAGIYKHFPRGCYSHFEY